MLNTMKMVVPSTTIKARLPGKIFIFGSWIRLQEPNDLDLLFVYDEQLCTSQQAVLARNALIESGRRLGVRAIHVVLLSESESAQCRFIESEGALPLEEWINGHPESPLCHLVGEFSLALWDSPTERH